MPLTGPRLFLSARISYHSGREYLVGIPVVRIRMLPFETVAYKEGTKLRATTLRTTLEEIGLQAVPV